MYEYEKNTLELEIWNHLYKTKGGLPGGVLRQKLEKLQEYSDGNYRAALKSLQEERVIRFHMQKWTLLE